MTDHYKTLDIPRDAHPAEITAAWRRAASEHHPDRNGDPAKFRAAREAFETLIDPEKRRAYDQKALAVSPAVTSNDYREVVELVSEHGLAPFFESSDECSFCDGAKRVRVDYGAFWENKDCPVCVRV